MQPHLYCCSVRMAGIDDEPIYDTASSDSEEDENLSNKFDILPETQRQLESIIWFHPYLTRHHSEAILRSASEGVYLMRKRSKQEWGQYSLDVKGKNSVKHFPITLAEDGIMMGSKLLENVQTLMAHFQSVPILVDESGTFVECKYPYPREINEFEEYHEVTCHFIYGEEDEQLPESSSVGLSAASKEGYIRKQGGLVKSWKTRWFVLSNNKLIYYSNHKKKRPIRVLLIDKIVNIIEDDDDTKTFRIVFPWRTFLLEAPTVQNKTEWVEILKWRLEELKKKKYES